MILTETKEKILSSEEFVLNEVEKLQYIFALKHEIRYGDIRQEKIRTESVAEHIYGMFVLSEYFLQLENTDQSMNHGKILRIILFHDIDEIETGDVIGYLKTDAQRQKEREATPKVIASIPELMRSHTSELLTEYENQQTAESKFVKAIDKIEPLFHLWNENGKAIQLKNETTREDNDRIKNRFVEAYPFMRRFNEVLNEAMDKEGFFTKST